MTINNSINWLRLEPRIENIGMAYDAGTGVFTIQGARSSLTSNSPAWITLQDRDDPGLLKLYKINQDQTFIDSNGASQIIGNLFGLTSGRAALVDIPFYIYAVGNDTQTDIAFMISRVPNAYISPVAAKIGKTGSAVASTSGSFFSLADITVADYEQNPCTCIGSFRMQMSAANDWTVQTFSRGQDGIGKFQEGIIFTSPRGHFGAAAGKYWLDNGGTAPDQAVTPLIYSLGKEGWVDVSFAFDNVTTPGLGAVVAKLALPFNVADGDNVLYGYFFPTATYTIIVADALTGTQITSQFIAVSNLGNKILQNSDFIAGTVLTCNGYYTIFID